MELEDGEDGGKWKATGKGKTSREAEEILVIRRKRRGRRRAKSCRKKNRNAVS